MAQEAHIMCSLQQLPMAFISIKEVIVAVMTTTGCSSTEFKIDGQSGTYNESKGFFSNKPELCVQAHLDSV